MFFFKVIKFFKGKNCDLSGNLMKISLKLKKYLNLRRALKDQLKGKVRLSTIPLRIHLEINDVCNLECIMCPRNSEKVPKNTGHMDLSILKRLSPWIPYANYIGMAGNGEPFLHPKIFEILELITRHGSVPSIVTNGTLLTQDCVLKLLELGPCIIVVSFDGFKKETFESIRVGADFDKINQSLKFLQAKKKEYQSPFPVVNFLVCIMRENKEELADIITLAQSLSVAKVEYQTVFPFTQKTRESMINKLDEIKEVMEPVYKRAHDIKMTAGLSTLNFGLQNRLKQENKVLAPNTPLFCRNIWETLHVGINGDVRFCCFWTGKPIGNLLKNDLLELWNHPEFQELRQSLIKGEIPEDCRNCHILGIHNPERIRENYALEVQNLSQA